MDETVGVPTEYAAVLRPDEPIHGFARARVPRFGTRRNTFIGVHLVIEAVDAVRNRVALKRSQATGVSVGFPLERNMAMVVTSERLVIFRAPRVGQPEILGEVPRSRIESASLPYVGGGWRTIVVRTTDGLGVRFQVDRDNAEAFASALSR